MSIIDSSNGFDKQPPKERWWRKRDNYGYTRLDAIKAYGVVVVAIALVIGLAKFSMEYDRSYDEANCLLRYETSSCLERRLKEIKAKETYQQQLEKIKKEVK